MKRLLDIITEPDNTITAMSKPIREQNGSGREWLHRGIRINDQSGSGVSPAYRWEVLNPDGIHVAHYRKKSDAIAAADKLVDGGAFGGTTCPDCTGQLREGSAMRTDWYGTLQSSKCMDCKQHFVSQEGAEYELSAHP